MKNDMAALFARVAPRYDLLNRVLSGFRDRAWRRRLVALTSPRPGSKVLDVCAGTGEVALEYCRVDPSLQVRGVDISREMLVRAADKAGSLPQCGGAGFVQADAQALPFRDGYFDTAVMAFGLRNIGARQDSLRELYRVLAPGGVAGILEFCPPASTFRGKMYHLYLRRVLPGAARVFGADRNAYAYLSSSIRQFAGPQEVRGLLSQAGFTDVCHETMTFQIAHFFTGRKPQGA